MSVKHYSANLRVKLSKDKVIKTKIEAKFQRRVFWFLWKTIKKVDFNVYDYWDPFELHKRLGEYRPMKDSYAYGGECETWKPEYFNLDKSLEEHWLSIFTKEGSENYVSNLIQ